MIGLLAVLTLISVGGILYSRCNHSGIFRIEMPRIELNPATTTSLKQIGPNALAIRGITRLVRGMGPTHPRTASLKPA